MELERSVLLPYSVHDMFDLIEAAEHYPQFLPWCTRVAILERSDEWVAARMEFSYLGVRFGFQTRNPKRRPEWLRVRLVEGPFKLFQGAWALTPLGQSGCRVSFAVTFEISDGVLDRLAARVVDLVARAMVNAFVKRAEATLTVLEPTQVAAAAPVQTDGGAKSQPPASGVKGCSSPTENRHDRI